ncbi:hypothetical protein [Pseudomonas xanthosomatis]|uniref:hypothetical protein n=1 Tax=Pseudomonas xanthosomatis TaxID=2842356 RepID=UPI003512CA05
MGLGKMEKLQFCSGLSGRRLFLRNAVLLGAGACVFGAAPAVLAKPAAAKGGFVVINGWVLPSGYFRDGQP